MKKIDLFLLKVFLFGLPIIVLLGIFSHSYDFETATAVEGYIAQLYDFAGLMFAVWMLLVIFLGIRLMISGVFRENVLTKITFIKERDEREVMLTGKAAKTTMLTTLAILIFLFCLSCFQVSIYSLPPENVTNGKNRVISLGLNFDLLETQSKEVSPADLQKKNILDYVGLPVSSSTVVLGLIVWQIVAYNYSMRRLMK